MSRDPHTLGDPIETGNYYKHYKGNVYKILSISEWSGDGEFELLTPMITYADIKTDRIYTQTKKKFEGDELVNNTPVKRFTKESTFKYEGFPDTPAY
jgi:hypothetical protein